MKVEEERQKELAREQRRLKKVRTGKRHNGQMKEEAIARGEEVSDSEEELVDEDPCNIGLAYSRRSSATPTSFWRWSTHATRS